jgi:glycosyltransferase involved in cell wall biosynthesis
LTVVHLDGIAFSEVPRGGISRMWLNVLNRLPRHGCRVLLYVPRDIDPSIRFSSQIEVIPYPQHYAFRPGRVFDPLTNRYHARCISRMWAKASKGVFQSTHFTTHDSLNIPQVATVHDLFHECMPDTFPAHQLGPFCDRRRRCIEAADVVVAVSKATLDDVDRIYGLQGRQGIVIQNAVDEIFLAPSSQPKSDQNGCSPDRFTPYLMYVGTRYPYKNFTGLLAAFADWERRNEFHLLVVGPPPDHQESAVLRGFGVQDRVRFAGHLSDEELRSAYSSASMLVVPSLSEGFGIPIWEAMACEIPVVAARAGAMPEVGRDVAIFFDFGAPRQLCFAFDEALAIRNDKDRLKRGKELATSFTWDDAAAAYADLYRTLQ